MGSGLRNIKPRLRMERRESERRTNFETEGDEEAVDEGGNKV